ncbi:hypothetical protein LLG46_03185 [bacterium]|nr:hypothetical protein [bacterium]
MRRIWIAAGLVFLLSANSHAAVKPQVSKPKPVQTVVPQKPLQAEKAPTFVLPSGAVLDTEINLAENDLLGMVKQALPSFAKGFGDAGGDLGPIIKMLDLNGLASAVQGVTALRLTKFKLPKSADSYRMMQFFESQVPPTKGWDRVLYSTTLVKDSTIAMYTQSGKTYLGFMLSPKGSDCYAVGTVGFVDIPKITSWAGSALKIITKMDDDEDKALLKGKQTPKKN